jgi:cytochrome c-type biogenesis protein CcmH/NrfG
MPTLKEMEQIADKQAAPLLAKLKADPNNSGLLVQVGGIYHGAHQFSAAAAYFSRAAQADPSNVAIRSKLAASLYRGGDADGAIVQLNQALHYAPTDANSLFNLGLIRWQGKHDVQGALTAWQQLLKFNPGLSPDRKAAVQHLIAEAKAGANGEAAAGRSVQP